MTERGATRQAWMVSEVRRCLDASLAAGCYTPGLLAEVTRLFAARGYNLHEVFDEIAILEGTSPRPSRTPPATELDGPLRGLWHKHHQQVLFPGPGPCSRFIVFRRLPGGANAYLALGCPDERASLESRLAAYTLVPGRQSGEPGRGSVSTPDTGGRSP